MSEEGLVVLVASNRWVLIQLDSDDEWEGSVWVLFSHCSEETVRSVRRAWRRHLTSRCRVLYKEFIPNHQGDLVGSYYDQHYEERDNIHLEVVDITTDRGRRLYLRACC